MFIFDDFSKKATVRALFTLDDSLNSSKSLQRDFQAISPQELNLLILSTWTR